MEGIELVDKLELTDIGRLLLMFECAKRASEDMNEREADGIAYLFTARNVLPFGYPFMLNPLPFSTRLHDDIYGLVRTGYLGRKNPIYITGKGSHWVSTTLSERGFAPDSLVAVVDAIRDLLPQYRRHAFDLIYTAMTI